MAKKTLNAEPEPTVETPPEIQFSVKPGLGEVTVTLGAQTRTFIEDELCGCSRAEWFGLAQTGCFDLVE